MPDRSLASSILGGAAVVLLAGVAAYVGTRAAAPDRPAGPATAPATALDSTLQAMERRLGYIERRLDLVEQKAETAMQLARSGDDARREAAAPPANGSKPGVVEPSKAGASEPKPDEAPLDRDDGADGHMKELRDMHRSLTRNFVVHQMKMLGDASEDGEHMRFAQALTEAKALMTRFGLRGNELDDKVRKIYQETWETAARDVGPLVRNGLEKADIATVRDRMRTIAAETDRQLRPLLDEETWKAYQEAVTGSRKEAEAVLEEFEKARLEGK